MKIIKLLAEQMKEELAGAKEYAMLATEFKTENPTLAASYSKMAQDELAHANILHTEAVKAIEKQKTVAPPPAIMLELWNIEHRYYVEHAATTKAMLDLYAK